MITAVIITWHRQQNVPRIVESLLKNKIAEIMISTREDEDLYCYRRFELAKRAKYDLIYTQDDDVINHDIDKLIEAHKNLTCGATSGYIDALDKPPYSNTNLALLGFGSLFWKKDIDFTRYLDRYPQDGLFNREADRIFTLLHPNKPVVIPCQIEEIDNLDHSLSGEQDHLSKREEVIKRCQSLS